MSIALLGVDSFVFQKVMIHLLCHQTSYVWVVTKNEGVAVVSSYAWSANDFPHQSGSISIRFETSVDTPLMVIRSDDAVLMSVAVRHAALWVESPSNEHPLNRYRDYVGVGLVVGMTLLDLR